MGEEDGGVDVRIRVYADVGGKNGILDRAAETINRWTQGIERGAHTVFLGKDKFAGGYWRWWVRMGHS